MPRPEDFTLVQVQASIFTPGLNYQNGRAIGHFLAEWPGVFTNIAFAADLPDAPPEIPRLIIQSPDSRRKLQAGPTRLDLFWAREEDADALDLTDFFGWSCNIFIRYLAEMRGIANRLACVMNRIAHDPSPTQTLSRHFCRAAFWEPGGPLTRPSDFELHASKQYVIADRFNVNSWAKFKTPNLLPQNIKVIFAEQDINTRVEEGMLREYDETGMREFFAAMPGELDRILSLYFPQEERR